MSRESWPNEYMDVCIIFISLYEANLMTTGSCYDNVHYTVFYVNLEFLERFRCYYMQSNIFDYIILCKPYRKNKKRLSSENV